MELAIDLSSRGETSGVEKFGSDLIGISFFFKKCFSFVLSIFCGVFFPGNFCGFNLSLRLFGSVCKETYFTCVYISDVSVTNIDILEEGTLSDK